MQGLILELVIDRVSRRSGPMRCPKRGPVRSGSGPLPCHSPGPILDPESGLFPDYEEGVYHFGRA